MSNEHITDGSTDELRQLRAERDLLAANVAALTADLEKYKTLVEDLKRDKAEVMTDLITADRELEHLRRTMASIRRDLDEAKKLVDQLRGC